MTSFRADLALLGLSVVGILADLACVLTGHTPPGLFEQVAYAGLTAAAGIAMPVVRAPAPAPVPPAAPAVQLPAPSPVGQ